MAAVLITSTELQTYTRFISTSGGTLYVLDLYSGLSLRVFKSTTGGASWSELTAQTQTNMFGSATTAASFSAQIDSSNVIHVVAVAGQWQYSIRDIVYATFTTSSDTWSSWTNVKAGVASDPSESHVVDLALDANGKPHIIFDDENGDVYYTNYVTGSWATPTLLKDESSPTYHQVRIVVRNTDTVEVIWTDNTIYAKQRTCTGGTWGDVTEWGADIYGIFDMIASGSDVYRYIAKFITSHYDVYMNNSLSISQSHSVPGILVHNGIFYYFVGDGSGNINKRLSTDGFNWSSESLVEAVAGGYLWVRWQYNFRYDNSKIEYLYTITSVGTYYNYINEATAATPSSKSAYLLGTGTILEPASDVTDNSWINEASGTNLYASLADTSDSTYVWEDSCLIGDYFEVKLESPGGTVSGAHTLFWKAYKKAGTKTSVTLKCELRLGASTVITSDTQVVSSGTVKEFNKSLTAGEIANITAYTDLRIRITVMAVA